MNLKFQIIDSSTGEILGESYDNLACNIGDVKDAAFNRIQKWSESCVRGIQQKRAESLELRISFKKEKYNPFVVDGVEIY